MKTLSEVVSENKLKLTKPQQQVLDRLLLGYKIAIVNSHHNSGGEYMWLNPEYVNSSNIEKLEYGVEYAGSIYKAFWNLMGQIQKQTGNQISTKLHIERVS